MYQSSLFTLDYREKERLLLPKWTGKELDTQSFIETMLQYRLLMEKTKAQKALWDHTSFTFSIPDKVYPWIEEEINLPAKVHGMKRIGFILGEDVMAQFSTMECFETMQSVYVPHYFADPQKAMGWITKRETIASNPFEKELQIVIEKKADAGVAKIQIEVDLEQLPYYLKRLKEILHEQTFAHQNFHKYTRLSNREREVLAYVIEGLNTKEIAERLFTSPHTISTQRKNIMNKLECRNIGELVKYRLFVML